MKDQVDSFEKKGISSAYVSSEQEKQCVEMREKVIDRRKVSVGVYKPRTAHRKSKISYHVSE